MGIIKTFVQAQSYAIKLWIKILGKYIYLSFVVGTIKYVICVRRDKNGFR